MTFAYAGYGRVATTTNSDNDTVTTTYDAFDRPTVVAYSNGT